MHTARNIFEKELQYEEHWNSFLFLYSFKQFRNLPLHIVGNGESV